MGADLQCCCQNDQQAAHRKSSYFDGTEVASQADDLLVMALPTLSTPMEPPLANPSDFASCGIHNPSDFASCQFRTDPGPATPHRFSGIKELSARNFASDPGWVPVMFVVGKKASLTSSEKNQINSSVQLQDSELSLLEEDVDELPSPRCLNRQLSTQAAGHQDSLLKDWRQMEDAMCENPEFVLKVYDEPEAIAYKGMIATNDLLLKFTPEFIDEVEPEEIAPGEHRRFLRLSNLLYTFQRRPHVMDCKMGCRSFTEKEIANKKLRPDLYQKMIKFDSSEPTAEENAQQSITKHRWMAYNDKITNTVVNSYRIDGISFSSGSRSVPKSELKSNKSLEDNAACIIQYFLPTSLDAQSSSPDEQKQLRRVVAETILDQLRSLRECLANSTFVSRHEFIGSSTLFVVDAHGPHATVSLIDFAKTTRVPDDVCIDHVRPWEPGNHEDGLFSGIDSLMATWQLVLRMVSELRHKHLESIEVS